MEDFFRHLLTELKITALVRKAPRTYEYKGYNTDFYNELFKPKSCGSPCEEPWQHSLMLDFFITDVEEFFEKNASGIISSGIWQEEAEGKEYLLNAYGLYVNDEQTLVIRNITDEFASYVGMLQKARENLLLQNKLTKTLDLYRQRLNHSALTAIYSTDAFTEMVKSQLSDKTYGINMAFLIVDIDNLKEINKTYGRSKGDKIVKQLGELFLTTLRNDDIIARYGGGNEFIILTFNTNRFQADRLANKIKQSVEEYDFGIPQKISISIGGNIYTGKEDVEACIQNADKALYSAHGKGPGTIQIM